MRFKAPGGESDDGIIRKKRYFLSIITTLYHLCNPNPNAKGAAMVTYATTPFSFFLIAFTLLFCTIVPSNRAYGQLGDVGDFLNGGADAVGDAELLFSEYLKPFASGFGAGVNTGWVDRARSHGLLGFHVKINFSAAVVPDVDQFFMVDEIGLNYLELAQGGPEVPTFSGSSSTDARLQYALQAPDGQQLVLADFEMPPGTGFRYIMTPMIQAGVGLPMDTDLMVRFVPPFSFLDYGEIYLYGLGIKHELNQWLPGGALLPVTFSIMGGYTSFGTSAGLNARPFDFSPQGDFFSSDANESETAAWDDQKIVFSTDAWTLNLIAGKSLPIFSVYGGVGIEGSKTNVSVEGNFPYYSPEPAGDGQFRRELKTFTDPLDISFDGANRLRAMAGVRISLPLLTFNVDYTYADYSVVTAGFGVSLR